MTPQHYDVFFHPGAQEDASSAAGFIASDSPKNAGGWYRGLEKAIESLTLFPHRCAIAPETQYLGQEYRHYIYGSYRIIFFIDETERVVRVVHVRHGARRAIGEPPAEDDA